MMTWKMTLKNGVLACAVLLLLFSVYPRLLGQPTGQALGDFQAPPPPPTSPASSQTAVNPAAVSSTLSYYFISGSTFTADGGGTPYYRQVTGCVNQMPLGSPFSAPVHLPQGSQIASMTLYTWDDISTPTVSTAYFVESDGKGIAFYTRSASSLPNMADTYQQNNSTETFTVTIDNLNNNYYVQWRTSGVSDSPYLSLCGVRVAYYAPLGMATFLPVITR